MKCYEVNISSNTLLWIYHEYLILISLLFRISCFVSKLYTIHIDTPKYAILYPFLTKIIKCVSSSQFTSNFILRHLTESVFIPKAVHSGRSEHEIIEIGEIPELSLYFHFVFCQHGPWVYLTVLLS